MSAGEKLPVRVGWDSEERLRNRRRLLVASILLAAGLVVGRSVQLQGFEGEQWKQAAADQHQARVPLPARRGAILDRDGVPLALTRETFGLSIAPSELRDRDEMVGAAERRAGPDARRRPPRHGPQAQVDRAPGPLHGGAAPRAGRRARPALGAAAGALLSPGPRRA